MTTEPLPVALEEAELDALLRAARESGPRDLALVTVMAYAGLRVSEAIALEWRDVREKSLFVRKGKGSKQRMVPLHWRVKEAVAGVVKRDVSNTRYLFEGRIRGTHLTANGARRIMVRLCAAASIHREKAHPHSLRHTFAVRLLDAGVDIIRIKDLLGHSSVTVTMVYLKLSTRHLRDAVDALA